jgi:hypothetical protein
MSTRRALPNLKSQGGQQIVEAVLIIVMLVGFTFAVANYFKSKEVLKNIITGPFQTLAGMLQNGVWATREAGMLSHPSADGRHIVITGEKAK